MFEIEINNGYTMQIDYDKEREIIRVITDGRVDGISEGDFVMLMNYYRCVKDNNIQCDFINPHGINTLTNIAF
jgi:hypothetical protein